MKRFLIPSLLTLLCSASIVALPGRAAAQEAGIQWRYNYAAARQEAKEKGRPLILDFGRQGCMWCNILDQKTLSDPTIIKTINENFIALKVDGDLEPKLVKILDIEAYPTVILADSDGKILGTMTGFTEAPNFQEKLLRALALVANPEPMLHNLTEANKALAASDYAKAVALLRGILEDGKNRPVQQKARKVLEEIEQQAAGQLAKAKQMNDKGQSPEAIKLMTELVRSYPGTESATLAGKLMTELSSKAPEITKNLRGQQARELWAQAKEDYRVKQHLCCLDRCKTLIDEYSDFNEAKEAQLLYENITNNPVWMQDACEKMAERMGNMHLMLADSYLKMGKRQEALATLDKVIKLMPFSQHAEIARTRLNELNGQPNITVDFKKSK